MSWIYKGVVFTDEHIPAGAVGFVYQMTAIIGNQSISYIGKKNFYANTKKKLSKKKLPTDKRKKNIHCFQIIRAKKFIIYTCNRSISSE